MARECPNPSQEVDLRASSPVLTSDRTCLLMPTVAAASQVPLRHCCCASFRSHRLSGAKVIGLGQSRVVVSSFRQVWAQSCPENM